MSERIMMTPEELQDGAKFLRSTLEQINSEVQALKSRVDEVTSKWEGASQQAFIGQFEGEMFPILRDKMPEIIQGVANELDQAAEALRTADESIASAFRG